MNITEQTPTERLTAAARSLGLTLESTSPAPDVRDGWPCISYQCRLLRDGREVWGGPYRLGVGHVEYQKAHKVYHDSYGRFTDPRKRLELTKDEMHCLNTVAAHKTPKDKTLHAALAAKLAAVQKVQPSLPDVLHSLLMDGRAHLDHQTFEDWCAEYGYDTDSRKAEETFRACDAIGRALGRAFTAKELQTLQDAAQDY